MALVADTTKKSHDFGVDIIARHLKYNLHLAIQTKFQKSTKIGNSAVQQVIAGVKWHNCNLGCVVSNNKFTDNAKLLARACNIRLLHHNNLEKYLDKLLYKSSGNK